VGVGVGNGGVLIWGVLGWVGRVGSILPIGFRVF